MMIRAKNIYKYYEQTPILKGIDMDIDKGEIVAIVGPSGAGKSTLLHILGTLDTPSLSSAEKSTASLYINDENILVKTPKELAHFRNRSLGFIFQFHQLLPEFTASENVCLPGFLAKKPKGEVEKDAKELLSFLGLESHFHKKPHQLSGGQQQRVAVARALINKPKVVFADEPSGNLDTQAAEQLHKMFFDLRKEFGQTFVIVTHNENLANSADRKLIMKDGFLVP